MGLLPELTRCMSGGWLVEGFHELLRNELQRDANGCFGQFRESYPLIAMSRQFGIERHGPEAGDLLGGPSCEAGSFR